jgi:hypothetical protein
MNDFAGSLGSGALVAYLMDASSGKSSRVCNLAI